MLIHCVYTVTHKHTTGDAATPPVFVYHKRSKTGGVAGLGMRLGQTITLCLSTGTSPSNIMHAHAPRLILIGVHAKIR